MEQIKNQILFSLRFLIYADEDIEDISGKEKHYSNLGLVLVGTSLKYHYNKGNRKKLSYNEILHKYIIDKIGLETFSVTKPENGKHNEKYPYLQYFNASPAGGYWISCRELRIFGEWINKLCNENKKIYKLVKKYGEEYYREEG